MYLIYCRSFLYFVLSGWCHIPENYETTSSDRKKGNPEGINLVILFQLQYCETVNISKSEDVVKSNCRRHFVFIIA